MKVTESEYRWHAANDKQYETVRVYRKRRRRQRSAAELEQRQDASRQGQERFERKEYFRAQSDYRFVMKRIEGQDGRTPLPSDLELAAQLRNSIEKYEQGHRI